MFDCRIDVGLEGKSLRFNQDLGTRANGKLARVCTTKVSPKVCLQPSNQQTIVQPGLIRTQFDWVVS